MVITIVEKVKKKTKEYPKDKKGKEDKTKPQFDNEFDFEILSCGHMNNLLLDRIENVSRTTGVCPKGDT